MDLYQLVADLCTNPKHTRWIAPLIILADAFLCGLIIWKIPCESSRSFILIPFLFQDFET